MAVFTGHQGNVRLRRGSSTEDGLITDVVLSDDVNTALNRLNFDKSLDNLITGDRVDITTEDARGLVFLPSSFWSSNTTEDSASVYINVNAAGGLRLFTSFQDAVNNNRATEIVLTEFAGDPLTIEIKVRDVSYNILGNVSGYVLNTEREAIDVTALADNFRKQYAAGLITGAGTIDCLFDYSTTGITEPPVLLLQLIHRIDIGSEFDLALYLTDRTKNALNQTVYYEMKAMVTRAGVEVNDDSVVSCAVDFITTGEIRLLIGEPSGYVLKEDNDRIELEQSLGYLLKEVED
jgi:hypothetical protein